MLLFISVFILLLGEFFDFPRSDFPAIVLHSIVSIDALEIIVFGGRGERMVQKFQSVAQVAMGDDGSIKEKEKICEA